MPTRWCVRFAMEGDARFLSHREILRLWERAAARAELPLKFTQGFNPHPKLSFVLARPVGVASRCELVVLEFSGGVDGKTCLERLRRHFPAGLRLLDAKPVGPRAEVRLMEARYEMPLEPAEVQAVKARLSELSGMRKWEVSRRRGRRKDNRPIDMKGRLKRLTVESGRLCFAASAIQGGSAGAADVLRLLGFGEAAGSDGAATAGLDEAMARLVRTHLECEVRAPGTQKEGSDGHEENDVHQRGAG